MIKIRKDFMGFYIGIILASVLAIFLLPVFPFWYMILGFVYWGLVCLLIVVTIECDIKFKEE